MPRVMPATWCTSMDSISLTVTLSFSSHIQILCVTFLLFQLSVLFGCIVILHLFLSAFPTWPHFIRHSQHRGPFAHRGCRAGVQDRRKKLSCCCGLSQAVKEMRRTEPTKPTTARSQMSQGQRCRNLLSGTAVTEGLSFSEFH